MGNLKSRRSGGVDGDGGDGEGGDDREGGEGGEAGKTTRSAWDWKVRKGQARRTMTAK